MLYGGVILAAVLGFAAVGLLTDGDGSDGNHSDSPDDHEDGFEEVTDPLTSTENTDPQDDVTVETDEDGTLTITIGEDVDGTLYAIKRTEETLWELPNGRGEDYTYVDTLDFYLADDGSSFPTESEAYGKNYDDLPFVKEHTPIASLDLGSDPLFYETDDYIEPSVIINNANVDVQILRVEIYVGEIHIVRPQETFSPREGGGSINGNPVQFVSENTRGTAESDWFFVTNSRDEIVTVEGLGDIDILSAHGKNITLIGGSGDDSFRSYADNAILQGNAGGDSFKARYSADIDAGSGDDTIEVTTTDPDGAEVNAGPGNDKITAEIPASDFFNPSFDGVDSAAYLEINGKDFVPTQIHGNSGNDNLFARTDLVTLYGDSGDDFIHFQDFGGTEYGGSGNDEMLGRNGARIDGGSGDDLLRGLAIVDRLDEIAAPVLITGDGNDRVEISISHPIPGQTHEIARVIDFDPQKDVLSIPPDVHDYGANYVWKVSDVSVEVAADNSHSDVKLTLEANKLSYSGSSDTDIPTDPAIVTVRLDGVTTLTADMVKLRVEPANFR